MHGEGPAGAETEFETGDAPEGVHGVLRAGDDNGQPSGEDEVGVVQEEEAGGPIVGEFTTLLALSSSFFPTQPWYLQKQTSVFSWGHTRYDALLPSFASHLG